MKGGRFARLKWVKPKRPKKVAADIAMLSATPTGDALRAAAATLGFPRAEKPTSSPKKQAIELLQAAAEVEQALLVQYLYAAYSLDPVGPAASLREIVIEIAKEEMGHLVSVQNLLLALGADPYFDRESVPLDGKPAGQFPFPLAFEPFSELSLAKYVTTESMPLLAITNRDLIRKLTPIFESVKEPAHAVQHVGLLYAKIFWLFQPDDSPHAYWRDVTNSGLPAGWHIPDSALTGLDDQRQAKPDDFDLSSPPSAADPDHGDPIYVFEIRDRNQALFALAQIARQGEGYQPDADSHFARFLKAYDDFAKKFPAGVLPVPLNPHTSPAKKSKANESLITHPKALLWAELFDIRYQLLLMKLWLAIWTDGSVTGALGRADLFESVLDEMKPRLMRMGGQILPALDLKDGDKKAGRAAAPFGLPDDKLPAKEAPVKARMKKLLADAEDRANKIKALPAPNAPAGAEGPILNAMLSADKDLKLALAGA